MKFLALLFLSAVSTFVPATSEGLAVGTVRELHWSTLVVAAILAAGQCCSYLLLYFFGELLLKRWGWLNREVCRVRTRYASRLETMFLTVCVSGGTIGVPPATALSVLAGSFRVPVRHLLPVLFVTRVARFSVIIVFGNGLITWAQTML